MRNVSPYSLKSLVKSALQAAKMGAADFGYIFPKDSLPKNEDEVTEFIRKRTQTYRDSWIIKPLEAALEKMERKKKDESS